MDSFAKGDNSAASPQPFTIRVLGRPDVAVMEALNDVFGEAFDSVSTYRDSRPSRAYLEDLLGRDDFIAVVALAEDEVLGGLAGYVLRKYESERSEVYIYDLAVAEPYRRQGIATALLDEARRIAAARGAWVVFVQADRDDEPALSLYSGLGTREDVVQFDMEPRTDDHSVEAPCEALRPIASLMSKSEKAQRKVAPGTWQHAMLHQNLKALRIASALMGQDSRGADRFSPADLQEALTAIDSMIGRTEQAQVRFSPGTAQHTLLRNRLTALRSAASAVKAEMEGS